MAIGKVTLNKINSAIAPNAVSAATSNSKNIQNQITSKEQHLNRLSSDSKLSADEKEKKRQEIQKEIDELNRKLELMRMKQEEAEKKAVKKQEKETVLKEEALEKTSHDKQASDSTKVTEDTKPVNMPIEDVQKMLNADYILQKELVQKSIDSQKESTVNILKAEIKQDKLHGFDTATKKEELESIRTKENFWTEAATESKKAQQTSGINPDAKISISEQF